MSEKTLIEHPLDPVWNEESEILILGTMPSPKSRELGFYYMHPQNRFWKIIPATFGEKLLNENNPPDLKSAINERIDFLYRHKLALWDVLHACEIDGASDASIKKAVPNDFSPIFEKAKIQKVLCTGKTAFSIWEKHCAEKYRHYGFKSFCLPSTSPANARWSSEKLISEYGKILRLEFNP